MNELLDKQVNKQKRVYLPGVHMSSHKLTKKVCNKKNKKHMHKNIIVGGREFIGHIWKTHAMDNNELQVDDC